MPLMKHRMHLTGSLGTCPKLMELKSTSLSLLVKVLFDCLYEHIGHSLRDQLLKFRLGSSLSGCSTSSKDSSMDNILSSTYIELQLYA